MKINTLIKGEKMFKLHSDFNKQTDQKYNTSAPEALINKASIIWDLYKSQPLNQGVDLEKVITFLEFFILLLQHTNSLIDRSEYDRRLLSNGIFAAPETTKQKAIRTVISLKTLDYFDAGRAADIVHNFYFCLDLQKFTNNSDSLFRDAESFCDQVIKQGV